LLYIVECEGILFIPMGFLTRLFSTPVPVQCRHDDLIALVNRLLDENKELQERLLPKPVVVERYIPDNDTKTKADTVTGWKPPRQRVRDFIEATNPTAALPLLSSEDREFLENSRQ
jgi:hypothetical protein